MKKVGILSMQRIANYGSFLQAYGLKSILEELDCQVQFVDYRVGPCLVDADGGYGIVRKLAKVAEVFRYRAPLADKLRFIKYKKNYTSNYYPMLGISDEMNYTPELDLLVIGSDEVFNCVQSNTNVGFSPELFGQNHRAKRLISYAGSFGNTTLEKLEQYKVAQQVASYFRGFDAISVRDDNSGKTVETLTGRKPEYHLDPVLAYDYMGKCEKIPQTVQESGYMLLYGYSGRISAEEMPPVSAYEGMLLYGGPGGEVLPLKLGPGLSIRDGVLYVSGGGGVPEQVVTVSVDEGKALRVWLDGAEVAPVIDESGALSWPGLNFIIGADGVATLSVKEV